MGTPTPKPRRRHSRALALLIAALQLAALAAVGLATRDTGGDDAGVAGATASSADPQDGGGLPPEAPPPQFGARMLDAGAVEGERVPGRVLVGFEPAARAAATEAAVERADAEVASRVAPLGAAVVRVEPGATSEAVAALRASPAVAYAERDVVVESLSADPNDMLWHSQWALKLVQAPAAWRVSSGSARAVVAVLDTGVDPSHPDLAGAILPGRDFVNRDDDAADDNGHGTAVAGIVAARANNGEGQAGVCPRCAVLPAKVLDASGRGTASAVAEAIVWAADRGARVIALPLGAEATTRTLAAAVAYAAGKGTVVVAAAGNGGTATPVYPAAHREALAVVATDAEDRLYAWSSRGSWTDLSAPGCAVAPAPGASYVELCGTSAAAAVVAGIAALAVAAKPGAPRAAVERALTSTARAVEGAAAGRVDGAAALNALGGSR